MKKARTATILGLLIFTVGIFAAGCGKADDGAAAPPGANGKAAGRNAVNPQTGDRG